MPITPDVEFEENETQISILVKPKGVGPDKVDVYSTTAYLKVNAERYLYQVDLKYDVIHEKTSHRTFKNGHCLVTLTKEEPGLIWGGIKAEGDKDGLRERRQKSIEWVEKSYDRRLELRKGTKEAEEKRYFNQHWDLEKEQRKDIEDKVKEEIDRETKSVAEWETKIEETDQSLSKDQKADLSKLASEVLDITKSISPSQSSPVDTSLMDAIKEAQTGSKPEPKSRPSNPIFEDAKPKAATGSYDETTPEVRAKETTTVKIDFTPTIGRHVPARGSHDGETYYQSRYKPKNAQDTPLFYKEEGDTLYSHRKWKQAANAYSEALKRDTAYLTALMNRSACWLRMHNYKRCIDDASLAIQLTCNSPASATTADRYRHNMVKLLVRKGTAYVWSGQLLEGLQDYRTALGYKHDDSVDVALDLQVIEESMLAQGLLMDRDLTPVEKLRVEADRLYHLNKYEEAVEKYTLALEMDPRAWDCMANRSATYLQMKEWELAIQDCDQILYHCAAVAAALNELGRAEERADSDDEEEHGNPMQEEKDALVKNNTRNVYRLLKAYIRKGAAYCGMGQYHQGAHFFDRALAIVPYDNDLRDDTHAIAEKLRMDTLLNASKIANEADKLHEKAKETAAAQGGPTPEEFHAKEREQEMAEQGETTPISDFIPAATFEGAKPGHAFKTGIHGTGYYKDGAKTETKVVENVGSANGGTQGEELDEMDALD